MFSKLMNIAGAILSGGRNVRMEGRNKALLLMDNISFIERTIGLFKGIFDEILVVTNSPKEYSRYRNDCLIVKDLIENVGPLGGIHAALSQTNKEAVFFVACDMPNLHSGTITRQIDYFNTVTCDALIPRIGHFLEPLHAIYKKTILNDLNRFIKNESDFSMRSFLKTIEVAFWDLADNPFNKNVFKNINTPTDLKSVGGIDENKNKSLA